MMRTLAALAIWLAAALAPTAASAHDCRCQVGREFHALGSVTCLNVNGNERLAICERVLNNTSWRILGEGCPSVRLVPPAGESGEGNSSPKVRL